MRADVQVQQSSALDLILSAIQKNIGRQVRIEASGREFLPGPRHQIYVGNIAFNATEDDVMEAIHNLTNIRVYDCTMPRSGDRNRGYAFVTIGWPSEFKHNGVDMDTFCDAIHRLDIKGRPSTRRRHIIVTSDQRTSGSGGDYIKQRHSSQEGMDYDPFMDGARKSTRLLWASRGSGGG